MEELATFGEVGDEQEPVSSVHSSSLKGLEPITLKEALEKEMNVQFEQANNTVYEEYVNDVYTHTRLCQYGGFRVKMTGADKPDHQRWVKQLATIYRDLIKKEILDTIVLWVGAINSAHRDVENDLYVQFFDDGKYWVHSMNDPIRDPVRLNKVYTEEEIAKFEKTVVYCLYVFPTKKLSDELTEGQKWWTNELNDRAGLEFFNNEGELPTIIYEQ